MYNTGNALGSTDARDLYDNAAGLDQAMNSLAQRWTDRFGRSRPTWASSGGYYFLGDYDADIEITGFNQVVRQDGEFWKLEAGQTLPYTTTGSWSTDSVDFVSVGDAILRQDLAATDGAELVTFTPEGSTALERTVQEKLRDQLLSPRDYGAVGDGVTDDTAAIQAALDDQGFINLGGPDRIYIVEGLELADGGDYTIIAGGAELKLKSGATQSIFVNDDTTFVNSVCLLGVKLNGNKAGTPDWNAGPMDIHVNRLLIDGCEIYGHRNALRLRHVASSARIHNNTFRDAAEHSGTLNENAGYINITTATDRSVSTHKVVSIQGNTFVGFVPTVAGRGPYGVLFQGGEAAGFYEEDKTERAIVLGNTFYLCGQDAAGNKAGAITLYRRAGKSLIMGNWIYGGDEIGIDVQSSENVLVLGNEIFGTTGVGISVAPRTDPPGGGGTEYPCKNIEVLNNLVVGVGLCGIWARHGDGDATGENLSIVGNRIRNVDQAIQVQYWAGQITVDGNRVRDVNDASPSAGRRCIDILGDSVAPESVSMRVCDNHIVDSANSGIRVRYYDGEIKIDGNTVNGCVSAGLESAIRVMNSAADITVDGNTISNATDSSGTDVLTFSDCSGKVRVRGNTVPDDATIGLSNTDNVVLEVGQGFAEMTSTRSGAGAIDTIFPTTLIATTASPPATPQALTLADGYEGQRKTLIMTADNNDGVLTPTNLFGGTTITFNDVNDWAELKFANGEWMMIAGTATLA